MTILLKDKDFSKYTSATVYLKNHQLSKIVVNGGIVSVKTDTYTVTIETKTNFTAFDSKDVAAIDFQ